MLTVYRGFEANDHGGYLVAGPEHVGDLSRFKNLGPSGQGYYNRYTLAGVTLYEQLKEAPNPNSPRGPFSVLLNRAGGYNDYKAGHFYLPIHQIQILDPKKGLRRLRNGRLISRIRESYPDRYSPRPRDEEKARRVQAQRQQHDQRYAHRYPKSFPRYRVSRSRSIPGSNFEGSPFDDARNRGVYYRF